MKKTLLLLAAAAAGASLAHADLTLGEWEAQAAAGATVFDVWSAAGGAWTGSSQPRFNDNEHIILSNVDSQHPTQRAELNSSIGPGSIVNAHMWGHYFYTNFSSGEFTLSPSVVAPNTTLIMMAILYTGSHSPNPTLNYGSTQVGDRQEMVGNPGDTIVVEDPYAGVDYTTQFRVFTWDVSGLEPAETFTISFAFPQHVAFSNIIVSQVPEPAAGVALLAGAAAGAVWVARRRRQSARG